MHRTQHPQQSTSFPAKLADETYETITPNGHPRPTSNTHTANPPPHSPPISTHQTSLKQSADALKHARTCAHNPKKREHANNTTPCPEGDKQSHAPFSYRMRIRPRDTIACANNRTNHSAPLKHALKKNRPNLSARRSFPDSSHLAAYLLLPPRPSNRANHTAL